MSSWYDNGDWHQQMALSRYAFRIQPGVGSPVEGRGDFGDLDGAVGVFLLCCWRQ